MQRRCAMPVMPSERLDSSWLRPLGGGVDATRKESRVGEEYQAVLPRALVPSMRPFPAPAPRCECALPAIWWRKRWWCSVDEPAGCDFEEKPPPFAWTPLCECGSPAKWEASSEEWTCRRAGSSLGSSLGSSSAAGAGCGFSSKAASQDEDEPRHASPTRQEPHNLERDYAVRTAALLTAAAYNDELPLDLLERRQLLDDDADMEASCLVCNDGENNVELLLLCDGVSCRVAVHTFCLDPPLARVPDDEWYCSGCMAKQAASARVAAAGV